MRRTVTQPATVPHKPGYSSSSRSHALTRVSDLMRPPFLRLQFMRPAAVSPFGVPGCCVGASRPLPPAPAIITPSGPAGAAAAATDPAATGLLGDPSALFSMIRSSKDMRPAPAATAAAAGPVLPTATTLLLAPGPVVTATGDML